MDARVGGSDDPACRGSEHFAEGFIRMADLSSEGVCVHRDGRILFANIAACRWMGVDPAEGLTGRRVSEFVHADYYPTVQRRIASVERDGRAASPAEVVMGRPRKADRDVEASSVPIEWDGRPAVVSTFRDLATTKAAAVLKYQAALLDHVSDAVIGVSRAGAVTSWNAAARSIYRRRSEDTLGLPIERAVGADLDPEHVLKRGGALHAAHLTADGSPLSMRVSVTATETGYVVVCADLTALRRAERYFEAVVTALDVGVVVFQPDGSIGLANPTARRIVDGVSASRTAFGLDVTLVDADGIPIDGAAHPLQLTLHTGQPQVDRVVGVDRRDGRRVWLSVSVRLLSPDHPRHSPVLCTFVDVSEQRQATERLNHAAHHDGLTGLPNRVSALALITASLSHGADRRIHAVLFIDLDDLKAVNDRFGHGGGDAVLSAVAERIGSVLREHDVVARIAGDEFVVLVFEPIVPTDLDDLVALLHRATAEPLVYGTADLEVTVSIGATVVGPDDARDAAALIHAADEAMYIAKAAGPGRTRYAR